MCERAAERGVAIGAQVGYRDLAGFGRRRMDVPADELTADVLYQLGALDAFARAAGTSVRYVKPHGALYNTAADDAVPAAAIVSAVVAHGQHLPVLGLPGSALAAAADDAAIPYVAEAFADRRYTAGGRLVDRGTPGAVLDDPADVAAQAVAIVTSGSVRAVDGTTVAIDAASLCVHGDTPGAVELAGRVRAALLAAGVTIAAFAG